MRLRAVRLAHNTLKGYRYDFAMFQAWCAAANLQSMPAASDTAALYITDLLTQGKKISTAHRRMCAIAYSHRAKGFPSPVGSETQDLLTHAQRDRAEQLRQMKPLTIPQLRRISAALAAVGTPAAIRDRALFVLGFASALRRASLAELLLDDVEFTTGGLVINVRKEKQDQEGRGRLIGIPPARHPDTDAIRTLNAWLKVRGTEPGPLFWRLTRKRGGQALDPMCVSRIVTKGLRLGGIDPGSGYGPHSLRAGFVTAAGEAGAGEFLIAAQTGHRNMTVLRRYFRRTQLFRANACNFLDL